MVVIYNKMSKRVTIICPIYNEEKYIAQCIDSILEQDYPQKSMELLLIDGMSTDDTRVIIDHYTQKYPSIRLIDNPERTVPYALNKGIIQSDSDVVIRIDAHCTYPKNYISTLVEELFALEADNVGGVWITEPAKDTATCHAIAIASSHPFGVGGSKHKIGAKAIEQVDTVPFGCYKRDVFKRIGLFDTDLTRNQDDECNARLIKAGGRIYLIPQLAIHYTARSSFAKMRKMYFQYGLFKPLVNKKLGSPATIRQFFPVLFVLGIIIGGLLSVACEWIRWLYTGVLLGYFAAGLYIGATCSEAKRKPLLALLLPYTFLNIHLSYGWGYLIGIYKVVTHQSFHVKSNH